MATLEAWNENWSSDFREGQLDDDNNVEIICRKYEQC